MRGCVLSKATGYAVLELSGLHMEKTIGLIAQICSVKDIKRVSYTTATINVGYSFVKQIRRIAEENNASVKIISKDKRLDFIICLFKRWWMLIILALAAAGVIILSQFCMSISVTGLEKLNEFAVVNVIKENGGDVYIKKSQIDLDKIEMALYSSFKEIAYADLKFDGTRLIATIGEGNVAPEIISNTPCSIVADKGGVVEKITVRFGEVRVKPGDIVQKGDVLISGAYTKKEVDFRVHAQGEVWALVDYIGEARQEYESTALFRTGRTACQRFLTIGKMKISLSGRNPFKNYEQESVISSAAGKNSTGFFKIQNVTYFECTVSENIKGKNKAKLAVTEKAYYDALENISDNAVITDFNSYVVYNKDMVKAIGIITVREKIGLNAPISNEPEDNYNVGEQARDN